jgi:transposase
MIRKIKGVFEMRKYDKEFKEEAVKLSDEVGVKQASAQLGIPYYTLAEWCQKRKAFGDHAFRGQRDPPGCAAFREGTAVDEAGPGASKGQ